MRAGRLRVRDRHARDAHLLRQQGDLLHLFQDLGVRAARDTDLEGFVLRQHRAREAHSEGKGQGRLQEVALVHNSLSVKKRRV